MPRRYQGEGSGYRTPKPNAQTVKLHQPKSDPVSWWTQPLTRDQFMQKAYELAPSMVLPHAQAMPDFVRHPGGRRGSVG